MDNGRVPQALDLCLARLRQGESLDVCLAEHAELAEVLRPLLELAATMMRDVATPPAADLQRARARFLRAADDARETDERAAEALDRALAVNLPRAAAGDRSLAPEGAGSAGGRTTPALAPSERRIDIGDAVDDETASLAAFAAVLASNVVTPPPPPHGLLVGRRRMLGAARRTARPSPPLWRAKLAALGEWLLPPQRTLVPRLAAGTVAVLLLLGLANMAVAPRVAAAIPGDPLYGLKRLGEGVRLAFAFDPASRARLEEHYSSERAREIEAVSEAGRAEEVTWQVRLVSYERDDSVDPPRRRLVIASLGDAGESERAWELLWDDETQWQLGPQYADMGEVPPGSRLEVRLLTSPDGTEPRALVVLLLDQVGPAATQTAPATALPATLAPDQVTTTAVPASPTASPSPMATPTPSPAASPTASSTRTLQAPATATAQTSDKTAEESLLSGVVKSKGDDSWQIAADGQSGRLVSADVSALPAADRDLVREEDWVRLLGHWSGHSQFRATELDEYRPYEERCRNGDATGDVVEYTPGSWLRLSTGQGFPMSGAAAVERGLAVGAQVTVFFIDCGNGDVRVQRIVVRREAATEKATGTPEPQGPYQGVVVDLLGEGAFLLHADNGSDLTVRFDKDVQITGVAGAIAECQAVGVYGWLEGTELRAARIEVYAQGACTPTPTTDAPTPLGSAATAVPTAPPTEVPGAVTE